MPAVWCAWRRLEACRGLRAGRKIPPETRLGGRCSPAERIDVVCPGAEGDGRGDLQLGHARLRRHHIGLARHAEKWGQNFQPASLPDCPGTVWVRRRGPAPMPGDVPRGEVASCADALSGCRVVACCTPASVGLAEAINMHSGIGRLPDGPPGGGWHPPPQVPPARSPAVGWWCSSRRCCCCCCCCYRGVHGRVGQGVGLLRLICHHVPLQGNLAIHPVGPQWLGHPHQCCLQPAATGCCCCRRCRLSAGSLVCLH